MAHRQKKAQAVGAACAGKSDNPKGQRVGTLPTCQLHPPVLDEFIQAIQKTAEVPLEFSPTPTAARDTIVVPLTLANGPVGYLIAGPLARNFPAQRREGLRQLLTVCARDLLGLAAGRPAPQIEAAMPCVTKARNYIRTHLDEPLRIRDVAQHIGLCDDHFGRVFAQTTGMAFSQYVIWMRVDKARELLTTTRRRISEVALACGFGSIPHFNRVFKRHTGQTPTAYRAAQYVGLGI